ncbi:hypothetical protein J2W83_002088 [Pseudomonas hunanensis]|uniref:Uncharacterized protein n=1 Tax=Pseudomonas hunanensis TaxID=1247546 RepID=A0ACC6K271_9PSED|nr:hypothetical protein [Pseudomonas hunanensis]
MENEEKIGIIAESEDFVSSLKENTTLATKLKERYMREAGYPLLLNRLQIAAVTLNRPAIVQPVTRIEKIGNTLAVPQRMAPSEDDLLGNVLFALKHEVAAGIQRARRSDLLRDCGAHPGAYSAS